MKRPPSAAPSPPADATTPSVWEYAGLMITYWCNARCAFCYVYSGPDRGGEMSVENAVDMWRGLDRLAASAGKTMRIHLAGGEPFGDWVRLISIIRAARDTGLTRLEKVETNAFWATNDGLTLARLELLDALGMEKLIVSADVYHQEFVGIERVRRCVEIARQVLGAGRVRVRWWDFYDQPIDLRRTGDDRKREAFAAAIDRHKDRLTGRAADRLPQFFERRPAAHFRNERCVKEVLHSKHVHIDPYGNVFPGVCSGIILGNALHREIPDLWHDLAHNWTAHPVVSAVVAGGSHELMQRAEELGYRELPGGYANKCHLCQHVRQFLVERGGWEQWVGPPECYANARDKKDADQFTQAVPLTIAASATAAPEP